MGNKRKEGQVLGAGDVLGACEPFCWASHAYRQRIGQASMTQSVLKSSWACQTSGAHNECFTNFSRNGFRSPRALFRALLEFGAQGKKGTPLKTQASNPRQHPKLFLGGHVTSEPPPLLNGVKPTILRGTPQLSLRPFPPTPKP